MAESWADAEPVSSRERFASRRQRHRSRANAGDGALFAGRVAPHSADAEEYLLSCCLLDGAESIAKALRAGVTPETFYVAANAGIWSWMRRIYERERVVAIEVLFEEMRSAGDLEKLGGIDYLLQISKRVPTTAQAAYFIARLRELEEVRRRIKIATTVVEQSYDYQGGEEWLADSAAELAALARPVRAGLPVIDKWGTLMEGDNILPQEIINGLLHRGAKLMFGGGSKSFKTWVLMDLALSVATGTPFWGWATTKAPVLYVNYELARPFFRERMESICKAKGIEGAANFYSWHLRGHASDLREQIPHFLNQMAGVQFALIVLDPIYKCLGERDENANGEVAALLNEVEALTVQTGAAVAFGHHFSKGNQSEKAAIDRVSGAGAWARDPDALVTLTPHAEGEGYFSADFTLRNLRPKPSMVVYWEHPCMRAKDGLDPSELRKPGRMKEHRVKDLVELLNGGSLSYSEWLKAAKETGVSESTFKRLRNEAIGGGLVEEMGKRYFKKVGGAA